MTTRVSLVTLGCARNDVDSEELAARFEAAGIMLVDEPADADAVVVNTCGFVEAAKKDSIDTVIAAADLKGHGGPRAVVAVGCLAERYGDQLSAVLPEADAVVGFDAYPDLADTVQRVLAGERPPSHSPRDRRQLLPLAPVERARPVDPVPAGPATSGPGPRTWRRRMAGGPMAPLKIASGCDRRCSFCAIPSFRGAFVSRRPADVVAEARWLAGEGVRELFCVSENSTSYGKDLGDLRLLETLLPELAGIDGIDRVRVSYLQPAEMRPSLVEVMTSTAGVVPYFDLSFQHASGRVLRRMRRFGDTDRFLELIESVRARAPEAGLRSNVIVGFPGEEDADLDELERFLVAARLDVVGVFGYSDEDGTEAESLAGKLPQDEVDLRLAHVSRLVEELCAQRAEDRIGQTVEVLVEHVAADRVEGRAAHQGPEVDGTTTVRGSQAPVGTVVAARVVAAEGADLVAEGAG
ncbi:MAG: 30S ribosomal protein S12 methylthiotransferase RimO [Actinomycetota bacterium]|nr:30S ribosomal protein S12 methylthiotransferase RimO [Actinomycetota bacterium]